jgi:hypothetical protein
LCWRHIYGSSKTSHCDLLLVPALFLLPLLQLILPSELCIARGVFPLTCRRGPHVAAASTHPSSSIIFGPPTRPRTIISSLVMVLCICSPSKKFPAIESPSCGSHPSLQKPQLQNRKSMSYLLPQQGYAPVTVLVGDQPIASKTASSRQRAWSPTGISVPCPKAQAIQNIDHETTAFNN